MGFSKVGVAVGVMLMVVVIIFDRPAVVEGAINCGQVQSLLRSCVNYVKNGGKPASTCCSGVKSVIRSAVSAADHKQACACVKRLAASVRNINYQSVAKLPGFCAVRIPFTISPSTDCTKVT